MADTLPEVEFTDPEVNGSRPYAIRVDNADFGWEAVLEDQVSVGKTTRDAGKRLAKRDERAKSNVSPPGLSTTEEHRQPFSLHDINISIPKGGRVYAIVGPVGSGKSSLIQGGMSIERSRTSGVLITQQALLGRCGLPKAAFLWAALWLMLLKSLGFRMLLLCVSCSAFETGTEMLMVVAQRANVIFGRAFDEAKYWGVINAAALLPDLSILPDGDLTEVSSVE